MPPSVATSQYPLPVGVASMPVTGAFNSVFGCPLFGAFPNAKTSAKWCGLKCRHGASWAAVALAVALAVVHVRSYAQGGVHRITRHTTAPTHDTCWLH